MGFPNSDCVRGASLLLTEVLRRRFESAMEPARRYRVRFQASPTAATSFTWDVQVRDSTPNPEFN